jgi:nucleotide-binding universal stress UspA family protein
MIDTVLIPFDGTEQAESAIEYTQTIFADRTIILLTAIDPVDGFAAYEGPDGGNWREQAKLQAKELLTEEAAKFPTDTNVETLTAIGQPKETITEAVDAHDADQIVIGSHSRTGIKRALVGSVAESVARSVTIPTTIV